MTVRLVRLLDANVVIDANRDYYPIDRVPEFWTWLEAQGLVGDIKVPVEVYEEFSDGKDTLAAWAKSATVKSALVLRESADSTPVSRVVIEGYAPDLADDEIEELGRDPFLISYALVNPDQRCIVTTEFSKPSRTRANRHIPDVCRGLGIPCCNTYEMLRRLDFRTNWRRASGDSGERTSP